MGLKEWIKVKIFRKKPKGWVKREVKIEYYTKVGKEEAMIDVMELRIKPVNKLLDSFYIDSLNLLTNQSELPKINLDSS